jgi:hypothetical protein
MSSMCKCGKTHKECPKKKKKTLSGGPVWVCCDNRIVGKVGK